MTADRWDSWPARTSQQKFLDMMEAHAHVDETRQLSPSRYDINLDDGTEVKVFMTDVYEFTVSDYSRLRSRHPDVNCIVQASNWNNFTSMAVGDARADGIGAFTFRGLMGALNYRGDAFLDYPDPDR